MRQPPIDKPSNDLYGLISKLDLIVWSSDLHRHFSDVSGGAERILGYTAQQWISDPNFWFDRLHPEDREWVLRDSQDAVNAGKSFKLEYRMRAADGRYVWLNDIAYFSDASEPQRAQMFGVMLDITERKIEEQAFREQQRRYEQMAENIQELFWMTALPTHEAIYVSPAFQTITGYSPEALLRSPLSYRDMIHPEDRERILSQSETAQRTGKFDEEFRILRADGVVRWVSARGFPVRDSKGNIYRFAGVLQDITARRTTELALRESEDRYRDLVEHSQDLLCTHDLQGKLLSCNPAPARLLGYSVEELLQIPMVQLIAPEARPLFPEYLQRIQRDGSAEGLLVMLTRSGQRRYWQYRNTLRSEGVPEPVVRGMAQDVTERRRAEKALRLSEERFCVAVKNARVMVSTQNRGLRYTWISNPVLAWAEQDCVDKSDDDLLHPEDAYRVKPSSNGRSTPVPAPAPVFRSPMMGETIISTSPSSRFLIPLVRLSESHRRPRILPNCMTRPTVCNFCWKLTPP